MFHRASAVSSTNSGDRSTTVIRIRDVGIRSTVTDRTIGYFAVPMLAIVLFHLALIVYRYIFVSAPLSAYLLGDIFLMLAMAVVSTGMLGQNAFRALIERFIERVG